ncbi:hypothetical protein ACFC1R_14655 [Kitasatospora sp. NPDC056138]
MSTTRDSTRAVAPAPRLPVPGEDLVPALDAAQLRALLAGTGPTVH